MKTSPTIANLGLDTSDLLDGQGSGETLRLAGGFDGAVSSIHFGGGNRIY